MGGAKISHDKPGLFGQIPSLLKDHQGAPTCVWGEPRPTLAVWSPLWPTLPDPTPTSALLCSPRVVLNQQQPHQLGAEKRTKISGSTQLHSKDLHINEISRRRRGFPCGSDGKESACNARDPGSIPGSGRHPGDQNGNPRISRTVETGQASMGSQRLTCSLSGGEGGKLPRVHCPLCCGPLPCIVCGCRDIVSSILRSGFRSGSCVTAESLQWCPAFASGFFNPYRHLVVSNSPAMQELGWENSFQEEMATHSSIPAWEIPWTEEPGGLQSMNDLVRMDSQK